MNAPVIDKPAPHCIIPPWHGACSYFPALGGHSDIRKTWERHVPGWQLRHRDRQPGQHGEKA